MSLVVRECLPEDAGAYTCVAENTAGKTSSSAAVCVRGKYEHKFNLNLKCAVYSYLTRATNVYIWGSYINSTVQVFLFTSYTEV